MGRLRPFSSIEIIVILQANGFTQVRQKGSHMAFRNGFGHTVVVPYSRDLAPGTILSIIRQSDLQRVLFEYK